MQHSLGGMLMPSCLQRPGAAQATPGWMAVEGPPRAGGPAPLAAAHPPPLLAVCLLPGSQKSLLWALVLKHGRGGRGGPEVSEVMREWRGQQPQAGEQEEGPSPSTSRAEQAQAIDAHVPVRGEGAQVLQDMLKQPSLLQLL